MDKYGEAQPCWSCKKYAGGCAWTDEDPETHKTKAEPVAGWRAVKTYRKADGYTPMESYKIMWCPEYEPDGTEHYKPEDGGRPLKWDLSRFMVLMRAGMTDREIQRRMGGMPMQTIRVYRAIAQREDMGENDR